MKVRGEGSAVPKSQGSRQATTKGCAKPLTLGDDNNTTISTVLLNLNSLSSIIIMMHDAQV